MRNKLPLVSIIIPVYNEEKYIGFCLSSLTNQTLKNKEIIVVDDGSTDKSLEKIRKFKVKLITQDHKGPGAARNLGAKNAKGEILAFLDADMKYKKDYVEKLINLIIKNKAVGTFNKDELVANSSKIWSRCWSINSGLPPERHSPLKLPDELSIFRAIKRNLFLSIGGFDSAKGYFDDQTIFDKLKKKAVAAPGAISYHYNPETLKEVFYSSRWIGRSFERDLINFIRFCPFNSVKVALKKIIKGDPLYFIFFKIVYDFGIFCGIFLNSGKNEK